MAAKLSHSDRSLKLKFEVLQNLDKETHQKDFSEKKISFKKHKNLGMLRNGLGFEENQTRDVRKQVTLQSVGCIVARSYPSFVSIQTDLSP